MLRGCLMMLLFSGCAAEAGTSGSVAEKLVGQWGQGAACSWREQTTCSQAGAQINNQTCECECPAGSTWQNGSCEVARTQICSSVLSWACRIRGMEIDSATCGCVCPRGRFGDCACGATLARNAECSRMDGVWSSDACACVCMPGDILNHTTNKCVPKTALQLCSEAGRTWCQQFNQWDQPLNAECCQPGMRCEPFTGGCRGTPSPSGTGSGENVRCEPGHSICGSVCCTGACISIGTTKACQGGSYPPIPTNPCDAAKRCGGGCCQPYEECRQMSGGTSSCVIPCASGTTACGTACCASNQSCVNFTCQTQHPGDLP